MKWWCLNCFLTAVKLEYRYFGSINRCNCYNFFYCCQIRLYRYFRECVKSCISLDIFDSCQTRIHTYLHMNIFVVLMSKTAWIYLTVFDSVFELLIGITAGIFLTVAKVGYIFEVLMVVMIWIYLTAVKLEYRQFQHFNFFFDRPNIKMLLFWRC